MQLLSDGAQLVRLVVFVVSLYSSDLIPVFLPLVIIPFFRLVPLVVVVVPLCVFSQSEMLNASLISSFIRLVPTISSFIRLVPTISSFIRLVSTISSFIRLVSLLPCPLNWVCFFFLLSSGPFYKKCTCYTCNTSSAFSLYLCNLFVQFDFVPFDKVV